MTRWFKEEADGAEDGRKSAIRALQAWQYLIGKAAARQIVQYDELRMLMEYPTSNPLGRILGCIMHYCQQRGLPPLTLLVVNKSGVPGGGFTAEDQVNYHQRREDVFNFPWFKLVPLSIDDFQRARAGRARVDA